MQAEQQGTASAFSECAADLVALVEAIQDAVWAVDCHYRIVTLNAACRSQLHECYGVEPVIGMNFVETLPPSQRSDWRHYYDRALEGDRFTVELWDDRNSVAIEVTFSPMLQREQISGVAVVSRNITRHKRVETEHRRAEAALQAANEQLQAVLDAVPGCISWFSTDLKYLGINRYLAATFNGRAEDFIGKELGFMEASPGFSEFVREFVASPLKQSAVEIAAQVDGSPRSYLVVAQKYAQDQAAVFVGLDISDRYRFQEALRESQERYALAMQGANDGLWDWNLNTNEIYFSSRWKSMLGYEDSEISSLPQEWFKRVHPEEIDWLQAQIAAHLRGQTVHFESEHRMLHKDGSYRWMLSRGLAVRDRNQKACRMAGSQTDITERKRAEAQLLHAALHDSLTNLGNRAQFMNRLDWAIERTKRVVGYQFAVLFLDIDQFKVVNDSLGHDSGDQLLIDLARRLETCLQVGDTLARLGGDEFTILLEDIQDADDAICLADGIHQALQTPFNLNGQEVFTTVSIGIALSKTGGDRPEELLRNADTAMYRAKAQGRARQELFDTEMHVHMVTLLQLETDLRRALTSSTATAPSEFHLCYQPIVALRTGEVIGFEALVRWQHPERGLIPPTEFIPVAEETGLIVPLGQWILSESCRQLQQWQQSATSGSLSISVNLSTKQFAQPDFIQQIDQLFKLLALECQHSSLELRLEITESAIMENPEAATEMLQQLKALGVKLAIDDFGTGYSSLSYLHQFPFDTVKIDRSFISRMVGDDESAEIVRAIVALAHNLGMTVVAEGVETAAQMRRLQALEAEYGQGYFFAEPLTPAQAGQLLAGPSSAHVLLPPGSAEPKETASHDR